MMRWLEEFELKHAEFSRCITGFHAMETGWDTVAKTAADEGYAGYARRQAKVYRELYDDAVSLFSLVGEARFVKPSGTILEAVQEFRQDELDWLRVLLEEEHEKREQQRASKPPLAGASSSTSASVEP
jgi:hypothetical protein